MREEEVERWSLRRVEEVERRSLWRGGREEEKVGRRRVEGVERRRRRRSWRGGSVCALWRWSLKHTEQRMAVAMAAAAVGGG